MILKNKKLTFAQALEDYISSKDNILSPSSVRGYRAMQRNCFNDLNNICIVDINEKTIQRWVNKIAPQYAPKTLRNQLGLVTVVLHQNGINLNMKSVSLKQKIKPDYVIPTEEDVEQIIKIVKDTNIEIPVIFALLLGLRQSEIASLKWENYDGVRIKVAGAIVPDEHNRLVEKESNKSFAGRRYLFVPDYLKKLLDNSPRQTQYISPHQPQYILRNFHKLCANNNMPKFTMHSLRHANASIMLKLGVPDKYAMERLGQSTLSMLQQVYQHLYENEQVKIANTMNNYFNELLE